MLILGHLTVWTVMNSEATHPALQRVLHAVQILEALAEQVLGCVHQQVVGMSVEPALVLESLSQSL